ncbi:FAD/NAD-P-binding domain-containing protein [Epithele typhae]|uniref:FAD/NAD-P-binding domain-containing protein n=1 Tax=Epithele typhae TaxID=378194 RepID=UPI00200864E0|nr:FAD/NAD-P-binding domain-containing protein [Epithele typhae]KAH9913453.1 FAD/NAD-P-binding domain-containing protein [Epithele typhae]
MGACVQGDKTDVLSIDFLIAGGSLCGLSAAIALRRVGHNVTVIDRTSPYEPTNHDSGVRLPPNSTKMYYRWGLKERLHAVSVKSHGTLFASCSIVGNHAWEESILEEIGGDTLLVNYSRLRKVLAEHATEMGVKLVIDTIVSVHPDRVKPSLKLESGETLTGDVVLGVDGYIFEGNVCRKAVMEAFEQEDESTPLGTQLFKYAAVAPEVLNTEQAFEQGKVFTWYGSGHGAMGFPMIAVTGEDAFALYAFAPRTEGHLWPYVCEIDECLEALGDSDPRLRQLVKHSSYITCVPIAGRPSLEEWIHPDGRLLCIGEGAHPTPVGSLFSVAMCTCDAACLGRLFSHLTRHDQIDTLLSAEQEIREARVSAEPGMMEAVEQLFSYDAEDEADDWWVNWGLMQERATQWNLGGMGMAVTVEEGEGEEGEA